MITGLYVLVLAFTLVGGPVLIAQSIAHDKRLEPAEPIDYDALAEDADTRYEDDADAHRKGER